MNGRAPELLDALKQEFENLAHDVSLYRQQRDEYERKLTAQLGELTNIQATLYELDRNHGKLKQQYEEEIIRLRRQLETGKSLRDPDDFNSGNALPSLSPLSDTNQHKDENKKALSENLFLPSLRSQEVAGNDGGESSAISSQSTQNKQNTDNKSATAENDWVVGYNPGVRTNINIDLLHNLSHNSVVCCVKFSNNGQYLATGCNKSAQIYSVESGKKIHTFSESAPEGTDLYIRSVCFSPDGQYLATGAEDKTVKLWNIEKGDLVNTFEGHELDIYSVDYSHDGKFIVSGSGDKQARIWNVETKSCVHILGNEEVGPKDGVTSVAISPDGKFVAAGSLDRIVRLWDAETGYFLERFEGHYDSVYSVAFSPDGKSLASGSLDKTLKIWDISGQRSRSRCRSTFNGHKDFVLSVAFSPDGNWLVSGSKDRSVQFWDPRTAVTHTMLQGHKNSVISVAMDPTGKTFATGSGDSRARIWKYEGA